MSTINSITSKNYKKLILNVCPNYLSFSVIDTITEHVISIEEVDFVQKYHSINLEECFSKVFQDYTILQLDYDEVVVVHDNNFNTFVPKVLFDEKFSGNYLQHNIKVFNTDSFSNDELLPSELINVYIPFANINNYLLDYFQSFKFKHSASTLVTKILDISKNIEDKQVFVHFSKSKFELIVVQNQNLLLFNSFDFNSKEDFIYYLLFTSEQLNINPEYFNLYLLGDISIESPFYEIAYQYVRNVSLLDVNHLVSKNELTITENLKHFILLQS